jgi:hypothetical protein
MRNYVAYHELEHNCFPIHYSDVVDFDENENEYKRIIWQSVVGWNGKYSINGCWKHGIGFIALGSVQFFGSLLTFIDSL